MPTQSQGATRANPSVDTPDILPIEIDPDQRERILRACGMHRSTYPDVFGDPLNPVYGEPFITLAATYRTEDPFDPNVHEILRFLEEAERDAFEGSVVDWFPENSLHPSDSTELFRRGFSREEIVFPTLVDTMLSPTFPKVNTLRISKTLSHYIGPNEDFLIQYLLSQASAAVGTALLKGFDPISQKDVYPPEIESSVKACLSELSGDFGIDSVTERQAFLLQLLVPVTAILEDYAKQVRKGYLKDRPVEVPQHIAFLAEEGMTFWSPIASVSVLEELSARIADASYEILDPEHYREDWQRTLETIFSTEDNVRPLLELSSFELQCLLNDRGNASSLGSQVEAFFREHANILVTKEMIRNYIYNVEVSLEDSLALSPEPSTYRMLYLVQELGNKVETTAISYHEILTVLEENGIDTTPLQPRVHLRIKSVNRTRLKRLRRQGQSRYGHITAESNPQDHKRELEHLLAIKKELRYPILQNLPYFGGDIVGVRVILPYDPSPNIGRGITPHLQDRKGLGTVLEMDTTRVKMPPDKTWPAIHATILANIPIAIPALNIRYHCTGPIEIQFTGIETFARAPTRRSSSQTRIHTIGPEGKKGDDLLGFQNPLDIAHILIMKTIKAADRGKVHLFRSLQQTKLRRITETPLLSRFEAIPLDQEFGSGLYTIQLVSSADTIPVSDLLPEVLRSLPFASPTVSLQLRQELQQDLSLSQPEILAAIIRAHSESFQTSHLTTDQSEKSVPFLRKFFKLVLSSGKDARLQNLQNQISEKIRMIIPRDSKSEIAAYSACVEILVNAYFQNQISGQYIARKALEAQKALQNRKKS